MIKSTLMIISASVITTVMVATLFLNSILGAFGLVTTSTKTLAKLTTSQQVVSKMKQKHKSRKINAGKRFAKRTGKRVASSAIAAATIGTVAVVAVVAGLEVVDYCDNKNALNEEGNILYGTDEKFDYETCMTETMDDSKHIIAEAINNSSDTVKNAWENTKSYSVELWEELRASGSEMFKSTTQSTSEAWDSMLEWIYK